MGLQDRILQHDRQPGGAGVAQSLFSTAPRRGIGLPMLIRLCLTIAVLSAFVCTMLTWTDLRLEFMPWGIVNALVGVLGLASIVVALVAWIWSRPGCA